MTTEELNMKTEVAMTTEEGGMQITGMVDMGMRTTKVHDLNFNLYYQLNVHASSMCLCLYSF